MNEQKSEQNKNLFSFSLDLELINLIRGFSNKGHNFEKGYLEKVYHQLAFYQGNQDAEMFDQYSLAKSGVSLKEIVLQMHIQFSAINNIQEFSNYLEDESEIISLNKNEINNTNILSMHTFSDLKQTLDHEYLNSLQNKVQPKYLKNFKIVLKSDQDEQEIEDKPDSTQSLESDEQQQNQDQEQEQVILTNQVEQKKEEVVQVKKLEGQYVLSLSYDYMQIAVNSKGKLDLYQTSYITNKVNKECGLQLYHILFGFLLYEEDKSIISKNIRSYTKNYSRQFYEICKASLDFTFNKQTYYDLREKFINFRFYPGIQNEDYLKMRSELTQLLHKVQTMVQTFMVCRNQKQQHYIEKLLIGMLGHPIIEVRDCAVVSLNVIYDGVDWQMKSPFTVKISNVGRKFKIDYLIEAQYDKDIYIQIKSNIFIPSCQQSISTIHKPKMKEFRTIGDRRFVHVQLDMGRFQRCGFYDWRIIKIGEQNMSSVCKWTESKNDENILSEEIKGRFIIHPQVTRDLQIHEVFVDLQNGQQDEKTGKLIQRGNFKTVTEAMPEYKQRGVNCLYLMGALERDNGFQQQQGSLNQPLYQCLRPDASPLAITSRDTPNSMMGGKEGFKELTRKAQELDLNIIVDSLTRVSSSRNHRKYKKHSLQSMDEYGKLFKVYGSDGRAVHFEDTSLLNYRKKSCWDLFLSEITNFTQTYNIQGLHLDNGQSWPQILKLDEEEMYRKEVDGESAYTIKEIFEGIIVQSSEQESGYWGSNAKENMPNPFLIKLCRHLWTKFPQFLIISEVWGSMGGFEEAREFAVIQSGPIPRLFKFPVAICQFFGKNLKKDGSLHNLKEPKNVSYFKKWYENAQNSLPEGACIIQSTTYHTFPYPALLYKRGTWAAVDLFFFMPDIPMTFIGEKEGKATKIKATNFFATLKVEKNKMTLNKSMLPGSDTNLSGKDHNSECSSPKSQSSFSTTSFATSTQKQQYQRVESAFFQGDQVSNISPERKTMSGRTGSFVKLNDMYQNNAEELQIVQQEGWGFIESLKGIKHHYEHRRKLRQSMKPLKRGKFVPLICELQFDSSTIHTHVLTFARYMKKEIAVIGINFNDGPIVGKLSFENLIKYFPNHEKSGTVISIENVISPHLNYANNHYFISELLNDRYEIQLERFGSCLFSFKVYENNQEKKKLAEQQSFNRLVENMERPIPYPIKSNYIALQLYQLVQQTEKLQDFINGFQYLYHTYLQKINLNNLISVLQPFKDDNIAKNKLFGYFNAFLQQKKQIEDIDTKMDIYPLIKDMIDGNVLGPICVATPEYGKYTKTGGLGVMTDELSRGLAQLGEDVIVITPIYDDKLKKNPQVLEQDGIKFWKNLDIWIGGEKYIVGIHHGIVEGVKLYFLANHILFPEAFCGEDANYIIRQLVLYARLVLQILCDINTIPSIMVTNDWFSGLIPGYLRQKAYGEAFNGTKVFHIAHNLDESYEGRVYPKPDENFLEWLHELPFDFLVDKTWDKIILNPSRCAFMCCDNWGTVSHSYKYELLQKSPLRFILETRPNAFSFPNGLNKADRLQMIIDKTGNDHQKAKDLLQKKYFGMQKPNNKIPLFGFVGRITEQKGVHLILDGLHQLIQETNYKVQIILGGMANEKEPYARDCAQKMRSLRQQYPNNFWADPDLFFKDGPLLNTGCDFGLMPSKFEPGGIVQHEFFVASTPVVATKTGGLQDTVYEYNQETKKGTGFVFSDHTWFHMVQAIKRAIKVFKDQREYKQLRKNAFEGTIDVSDVSRAYAIEFYRMFNKNFLDKDVMNNLVSKMDTTFSFKEAQPIQLINKGAGIVLNKERIITTNFEKILQTQLSESKQIQFKFKPPKGTFPRIVQIIGSFDDWSKTYDLKYDQFSREWKISLSLRPNDYQYKYKVDDSWMINPNEPQDQDQFMNVNNVIRHERFLNLNLKQQTSERLRKTSSDN